MCLMSGCVTIGGLKVQQQSDEEPVVLKPWAAIFSGLDPTGGGIPVSGRLAWAALSELGTPHLVCYGPTGDISDLPGATRRIVGMNRGPLAARLLIRRWDCSGILFWHIGLLKLLPVLRGFRGRVVVFLHGIEAWRPPGRLTRRLLGRVDLFLSNSDYTWQRFLEFVPEVSGREHRTVPLGWGDPINGSPLPPSSTPSAVIIGRLAKAEDYKGHRELILTWPRVVERIPGAILEVIGDGDLRPELERLTADLQLSAHVRYHGRVSEGRKAELLSAARCLAMPSRGEGFGLVYLEAMRLGRPCLVSNSDAGREVVNPPEGGLAVDVGNTVALADAIVRLLTGGEEWQRWSAAARRRYEAQFTAMYFQERLRAAVTGGS